MARQPASARYSSPKRPAIRILCFLLALGGVPLVASSSSYQVPSQALVDVVDAPTTPQVSLDPTEQWLLLMEVPSLPSIAELAERELRLAGTRIKPQSFGPSRTRPYSGLSLVALNGDQKRDVSGLPSPARQRARRSRYATLNRQISPPFLRLTGPLCQ